MKTRVFSGWQRQAKLGDGFLGTGSDHRQGLRGLDDSTQRYEIPGRNRSGRWDGRAQAKTKKNAGAAARRDFGRFHAIAAQDDIPVRLSGFVADNC
jgi:hypothetical protein